jgi:hypothetical protein
MIGIKTLVVSLLFAIVTNDQQLNKARSGKYIRRGINQISKNNTATAKAVAVFLKV